MSTETHDKHEQEEINQRYAFEINVGGIFEVSIVYGEEHEYLADDSENQHYWEDVREGDSSPRFKSIVIQDRKAAIDQRIRQKSSNVLFFAAS